MRCRYYKGDIVKYANQRFFKVTGPFNYDQVLTSLKQPEAGFMASIEHVVGLGIPSFGGLVTVTRDGIPT